MVNAPSAASRPLLYACLALLFFGRVAAQVFTCVGGSVYVVAHPDDDLLFQSPDLFADVTAGNCITTVFLTSGDSGIGSTYAQSRESGNEAATAQMAGVADAYTEFIATFGGQPVLVRTLTAAPNNQKVWFRLPDGAVDGTGFSATGYQTLRALWFGSIGSIKNQPGTSVYSLATLKLALAQILAARQPSFVRTLDYMSDYDAGDHSDHLTVARMTESLVGTYASNASLSGYMGYPVQNLPPTLSTSSAAFTGKSNAFFAYTPYDSGECQAYSSCVANGRGEASWLVRQYIVTEDLAETDYTGSAQDVTVLPNSTNVAPLASIVASNSVGSSQPATNAIDGIVSGYPGNSSAEWSSKGGGVGTTLKLTWTVPQTLTAIVLYDRPNANDWMTGGTLTFSDTSVVAFGYLFNEGSATSIPLTSPITTLSVLLTVTSVSKATSNVGLAEIQAYGTPCPGCVIGNGSSTANVDIARLATATASSYGSSTQTPDKAIDGIVSGYPTDSSKEWASNGETVGAWLKLTWSQSYSIDSLSFFDRPNSADWITGGKVTWSDGTTLTVPSLNNAGLATTLTFPAVKTTSLLFTVTSAGPNSGSVGLAELEAFYSGVQTNASAIPVVVAPVVADLALSAVATASSYSNGQPPSTAIDGLIGGYTSSGGIYTQEWASAGGKAGTTLTLTWASPVNVAQVVLYDRPNPDDQVTGGTLTFSDGSVVQVPSLNNDGTAVYINISPARNTTTILFTVTSVSSSTGNVGLSEIQVYSPSSAVVLPGVYSFVGDLALNATATASSVAPNQDPEAAIDGFLGGYTTSGGDYTQEWASNGGGKGTTLTLTWAKPILVNLVVLYDRPNLADQCTGSTLTFSNGVVYTVGSLPNAGTSFPVTISPAISTSSLVFTVTSVSSSTGNVGLSEIQVFGPTLNTTSATNSTTLSNSTLPLSNSTIVSNSTLVNTTLFNSTLSSALPTPSANVSSNATLATLSAFWSSAYPIATANASLNISSSGGYLASGSAIQTGVANATAGLNLSSFALPTASASVSASWAAPSAILPSGLSFASNDSASSAAPYLPSGSAVPTAVSNLTANASSSALPTGSVTSSGFSAAPSVAAPSGFDLSANSSSSAAPYLPSGSAVPTAVSNATANASSSALPTGSATSSDLSAAQSVAAPSGFDSSANSSSSAAPYLPSGSAVPTGVAGAGELASIDPGYASALSALSSGVASGAAAFPSGPVVNNSASTSGSPYLPSGSAVPTSISPDATSSTNTLESSPSASPSVDPAYLSALAALSSGVASGAAAFPSYIPSALNGSAPSTAVYQPSGVAVPTGIDNSTSASTSALLSAPTDSPTSTSALPSSSPPAASDIAASAVSAAYSGASSGIFSLASAASSLVLGAATPSASAYLPTGSAVATGSSSAASSSAASSSGAPGDSASSLVTASSLASRIRLQLFSFLVNGAELSTIQQFLIERFRELVGIEPILNCGVHVRLNKQQRRKLAVERRAIFLERAIFSRTRSCVVFVTLFLVIDSTGRVSGVKLRGGDLFVAGQFHEQQPRCFRFGNMLRALRSMWRHRLDRCYLLYSQCVAGTVSSSSSSSVAASTSSSSASSSSTKASSTMSSSARSSSSLVLSSSTSSKPTSSSISISSTSSSKSSSITPAPSSSSKLSSSSVKASSTSSSSTGYPTAPAPATTVNIALRATATASSEISKSPAKGVIDGNVGGLSLLGLGVASQEWASNGQGVGAWIQLNFTSTYLMKQVVLFDRVNTLNSITGGTLRFSDGTSYKVTALSSSGSTISLGSAGIYASSLRFTVTSVSLTTTAVGLAEIRIFNGAPATSTTLVGSILNVFGL